MLALPASAGSPPVPVPVPVKAGPRNEVAPAAGGDYFAWAKSRRGRPNVYDVWAQRGTETPFKVNSRGTTGWTGGFGGSRLVYQQVRGGRQSDIRFFDVQTRRRSQPSGVNTKRWEWAPTISGDWLLFGRGVTSGSSTQQIILRNLATGEQRVLDALRNSRAYVEPGQVNGNYAVWTRCSPSSDCDVFRYDIATRKKARMPRTGQVLSGPSVAVSGTTYYGRTSHGGCGAGAELVKTSVDGATVVLYSFPETQDVGHTYAVVSPVRPPVQTPRIYFERVTCSGQRYDIYSIDDIGG